MAARLKTANRSCQSLWSEYLFSKKQRGQSVRMVDHEADLFWRVGIIGRTFWQDSRCRSETHYDIDDEKMTRLRSILCRGQLLLPADRHLWRLQGEIRWRFM